MSLQPVGVSVADVMNKTQNNVCENYNFHDFISILKVKLREEITFQKTHLNFEDLHFILSAIQEELNLRNTIREMIPSISDLSNIFLYLMFSDDVWIDIFRRVSLKKDISTVFPLKLVCKHWSKIFSSITEATIVNPDSSNWYSTFIDVIQLFALFCLII
jgi:hypothetical protein